MVLVMLVNSLEASRGCVPRGRRNRDVSAEDTVDAVVECTQRCPSAAVLGKHRPQSELPIR